MDLSMLKSSYGEELLINPGEERQIAPFKDGFRHMAFKAGSGRERAGDFRRVSFKTKNAGKEINQ